MIDLNNGWSGKHLARATRLPKANDCSTSQISSNIEMIPLKALKPFRGNARTHSAKQLDQIAKSIQRFGFTNPVLVDNENCILAGHGRVAAARLIGLKTVTGTRWNGPRFFGLRDKTRYNTPKNRRS